MILFSDKAKYISVVLIVVIALYSVYFLHATREINTVTLKEKLVAVTDSVDMLAASLNTWRHDPASAPVWRSHVVESVEYLDRLFQIFGAVYEFKDGELIVTSRRYYETSIIDPFDYPHFVEAVHNAEKGTVIIGYTPAKQSYRELHIYFRWMPLWTSHDRQMLVLAGVSEYSVVSKAALWATGGQWVMVVITVGAILWVAIRQTLYGYIWPLRRGADKYRDKKVSNDR